MAVIYSHQSMLVPVSRNQKCEKCEKCEQGGETDFVSRTKKMRRAASRACVRLVPSHSVIPLSSAESDGATAKARVLLY
jgi:hypothetical protein